MFSCLHIGITYTCKHNYFIRFFQYFGSKLLPLLIGTPKLCPMSDSISLTAVWQLLICLVKKTNCFSMKFISFEKLAEPSETSYLQTIDNLEEASASSSLQTISSLYFAYYQLSSYNSNYYVKGIWLFSALQTKRH